MGEVVKGRLISNNVAIGSSIGGSLAQRAYSPTVELTETEEGVRIEMTDVSGTQEATVYNGRDYVLTDEDKEEIADIAKDSMDYDDVPTDASDNLMTSGAIKEALDLKADKTELPVNVSELNNDAGYLTQHQDISGKQDKLTFDNAPTAFSSNPVKSSGIYDAIRLVNGDVSTLENDMVTVKFEIGTKVNKTDVESALSSSSVNPVQNKTVKAALDLKADKTELPTKVSDLSNDAGYLTAHQDISGKQDKLTFDDAPTTGSTNPVKSGGINIAISALRSDMQYFDNQNANAISNLELNTSIAIGQKQDALTFDNAPTALSDNPVKSKGIKTAIDAVANSIPTKVSDLTDDSGHYTKPASGIPAGDLASGIIPTIIANSTAQEKTAIRTAIGAADVATIQAVASDAEAYAQGTRNGTAVGSSDPAYHNNAKYYSEMAFAGTTDEYDALVTDVSDIKRDFVRISNQAIDELLNS